MGIRGHGDTREGTASKAAQLWPIVGALLWCAGIIIGHFVARGHETLLSPGGRRVTVSSASQQVLRPMQVPEPKYLRWRDIGDAMYSNDFRDSFDYAHQPGPRVTVGYQRTAETLRGHIEARGLKPWFAYQLKLVGTRGLAAPGEQGNTGDAALWSSYQLGRLGRWWCEECEWNVSDEDLRAHLLQGHTVKGYLLFDWFVTDARGDCDHDFSLDSSLHVLWRVGQRDRGPKDSAPRWYGVTRSAYAYPKGVETHTEQVGLYSEWEPARPPIGSVRLPPGEYHVRLNLTEESFHANLSEENTLEGGGLWAWVLEGDLQFQVNGVPTPRSKVIGATRRSH